MHPRIFRDDLLAIQRTCAARALLNNDRRTKPAALELGVSPKTLLLWMRKQDLKTLDALVAAAADTSLVPHGTKVLRAYKIFERAKLERALDENGHNQTNTAKALGVSRRALIAKLSHYRLRRIDQRAPSTSAAST
jgi:transcriptional regulator with PAS, ATPase and Fis domain